VNRAGQVGGGMKRETPSIEAKDVDPRRPRLRPWLAVMGVLIAVTAVGSTASVAGAATPIGPHQHFDGVVNGHTSDAVVYTVCPGPAASGRTGPPAGGQTMAVARARADGGNTGPFRQVYAWFAQDASSSRPIQLQFNAYGVKQSISTDVRLPCDGKGQAQFSSCPYLAPCAAGFVPDLVDVRFVNIAD
jgi:hypothetical protein